MERPEASQVRERYARRTRVYDPLDPSVYLPRQELERTIAKSIKKRARMPRNQLSLLEVGCGTGGNLLSLLRLGFQPKLLTGCELQESRAQTARDLLPASVRVLCCDALDLPTADDAYDLVSQFLVFSSILDNATQTALAEKMWTLLRPGGALLWYDFTYNNPANPDVRGMPLGAVRKLFPAGRFWAQKITLAPPLSRIVAHWGCWPYNLVNSAWFLRTHLFCWIEKPA